MIMIMIAIITYEISVFPFDLVIYRVQWHHAWSLTTCYAISYERAEYCRHSET